MNTSIPSAADIRVVLEKLSHAQVGALAERSKVPFTTLWKIRAGDTENPRLETVRQFMPFVSQVASEAA